jgi:hypothetical protein
VTPNSSDLEGRGTENLLWSQRQANQNHNPRNPEGQQEQDFPALTHLVAINPGLVAGIMVTMLMRKFRPTIGRIGSHRKWPLLRQREINEQGDDAPAHRQHPENLPAGA